jgi:rhamnulokinase
VSESGIEQGESTDRVGFIAVDLGSSTGRVMLGTVTASTFSCTLEQAYRFANVPLRPGERGSRVLAWDTDRLFDETLEGMKRAVSLARSHGVRIAGVGVDAWGVDYGRIGTDGRLRLPVKHHRGADETMPALDAELVDPETAYRITGVLDQTINTSHQLRTDALHGVATPGETVLLVPDLWVHLLSGAVGAERTIASTTQLLDRETGEWSRELTAAWGISATLPPLVDDGHYAGQTLPQVTERIGSGEPIPVYYVTSHDTASAFAAAVDPGTHGDGETVTGIVSSGSWAVAGIAVREPVLTEEARLLGFTQELGAGGVTLLVRNLNGMWLLQECVRAWSEEDASAVDLLGLVAEAGEVEHPAVIDVADESLQRPGHLPERIADSCEAAGHRRPSGRAELVHVILRSLAIAYADTLRVAARLAGRRLAGVRIIGGGARNDLLCLLTAEESGLPVVAGPAEASSLGIIYRLAVASGVLPSMELARSLELIDGDEVREFLPGTTPDRKVAT